MRSSANTFEGVASNLICYYQDISDYNQKLLRNLLVTQMKILDDLKERLINLESWTEASLDEVLVRV